MTDFHFHIHSDVVNTSCHVCHVYTVMVGITSLSHGSDQRPWKFGKRMKEEQVDASRGK